MSVNEIVLTEVKSLKLDDEIKCLRQATATQSSLGCCQSDTDARTTKCGMCRQSFHLDCLGLTIWPPQAAFGGAYVCRSCLQDARAGRCRIEQLEKLVASLREPKDTDWSKTQESEDWQSKSTAFDQGSYSHEKQSNSCEHSYAFSQASTSAPVNRVTAPSRNVARKRCAHSDNQSQTRQETCGSRNVARKMCSFSQAPRRIWDRHSDRNVARKSCSRPQDLVSHRRKRNQHVTHRRRLSRHMRLKYRDRKHPPGTHACSSCELSFGSQARLRRHTWWDHIGAIDDNSGSSSRRFDFKQAGDDVHVSPYSCEPDSSLVSLALSNPSEIKLQDQFDRDGNLKKSPPRFKEENISDPKLSEMGRPMSTLNGSRKFSNDDNYLYCGECKEEFLGDCPNHGPMYRIHDAAVSDGDPLRANSSIPPIFTIGKSGLANAGQGVFSNVNLPQRSMIGPYRGKVVAVRSREALTSEYVWEIKKDRKTVHCIDGKDLAYSNWMRYINCANHSEEQNMTAFQYKGNIYYRSIHPIARNTELLVWYGRQYAKVLGLLPERQKRLAVDGVPVSSSKRPCADPNNLVQCSQCHLSFSSEGFLRLHVATRHEHVNKENYGDPHCLITCDPENMKTLDHSLDDTTDHLPSSDPVIGSNANSERRSSFRKPLVHTEEEPRPFNCHICGTAYKQLSHLTEHEFHTHNISIVYACRECPSRFDFFKDLVTHQRESRHRGRHRFRVGLDDDVISKSILASSTNDKMERQLMSRVQRLCPHRCNRCGASFRTIFRLRQHEFQNHGIRQLYGCKTCLLEFDVFPLLLAHRASTGHKGTIKRAVGPESPDHERANSIQPLEDRALVESGPVVKQEPKLKVEYGSRNAKLNQVDLKPGSGRTPARAKVSKTENCLQGARRQGRKPLTNGIYKCSGCTFSTNYKGNLRKHERKEHGPSYPCQSCGHAFRNHEELGKHQAQMGHGDQIESLKDQILLIYQNR